MNFMRTELPEPEPSKLHKLLGQVAIATDGVLVATYDIPSYRGDLDVDNEDLLRTAARELFISEQIGVDLGFGERATVVTTLRNHVFRINYIMARHPHMTLGMSRN